MGKVRTGFVKRTAKKMVNKYPDEVTEDFENNKKIAQKHINFPSKKLRNLVVGYATKYKRTQNKARGE